MGRIKRSCSALGLALTLALRLGLPGLADLLRLLLAALLACLAVSGAPRAAEETRIALETHRLRYCIDPAGRVREFTDLRTGVNHLAPGSSPACARLGRGGEVLQPESARLAEGRLELRFAGVEEPVVLGVRCRDRWIELEVESAAEETDSLLFLDVPLALRGRPSEPFGGCAFALDLRTQVAQLPALQTHLLAKTFRKFGHRGARVALVGAPPSEMLDIFKDVIRSHPETPQTTASGPWAGDVESSRGSYLFNFGDLTPANVEDWIARVKSLGFTQIDSHGGSSFFRFGDLELNRRKWPRGWEEFREINRRLHDEGIGAIFHTYAFFIDKRAKYVTPVPDARLDAFRSFTLSEAVTEDATEIPVVESTRDVSTITGFFVRNSVTLHVGDELITFGGAAQEAPFRFTGCRRGAIGTKAAAHAAGAKARHLKECFGLFVPDVDSDLFGEIAASHARIVNECRFDGIYLDAIDGSDILRGSEESWYHASRFVHEIWRHLDRPVGMEMSAMWHHFWKFRSRWQAWDYPTRGHKRFIDIHAASVDGSLLLPLHLGWWNFQTFSPPQVDPSYPDVIEYLGCKLIGFDAGVSLTGAVSAERLRDAPAVRRLVDLLRTYEELRRSGSVGEALKKRLREPGKEFTLERAEDGR
ncbi:MAG: hypothetical protein JXA90_06975, partial [Planctomycetes bacterium]|nr:hypothetical protein [Planctomycetota bacterium]